MIPPHLLGEYAKAHAPAPHDSGWAIAGAMLVGYTALFLVVGLLLQPLFAAIGVFAVPAALFAYVGGFVGLCWTYARVGGR